MFGWVLNTLMGKGYWYIELGETDIMIRHNKIRKVSFNLLKKH